MKMLFVLILFLFVMPVLAQSEDENCPALVESALELTTNSCEDIGRDKVCYGHSTLEVESRPGDFEFQFEAPGDIEDVIEMKSLNLSPMDTAENIWGVILMQVRANLVASEQKNVTFVVFGDVALSNEAQVIPVTLSETANIRSRASTEGGVLASIEAGASLAANGRSEDGTWIRVQLPDDETQNGWVSASLVETTDDLETLQVATETPFGPMQAFYFESGRDDAPCSEAPNSGLMIQTPEGAASVTLWIDEVIIELDGTTFVQAQPNGDLTVNTLEGSATVTAFGESQTAVAGTQVSVAIDEDLGAVEAPQEAVPFDAEDVAALPTTLLENPVTIPEPLALGEGVPAPGNWSFSWGASEMTCPDGTVFTFESEGSLIALTIGGDGETISYSGMTYTRASTGVYTAGFIDGEGNLHQETLTVNSISSISGETQIEFAAVLCTLNVPFSLRLVG